MLQGLDQASVKLTNNRLYLDYNATAPLDETVLQWLSKGAFPFGNPSSIHNSGKLSKRLINQTREYLFDLFSLKEHQLFFHSGATEGINDIVKGFALRSLALSEPFHVIASISDHSCIINQKEHIELLGGCFHELEVDRDGRISIDDTINLINSLDGRVLLNYTYINNETGVIWDLKHAKKIKDLTNCFVHVDAVQLIGKYSILELESELDAYTFSGHKFGALKGIGFSFVNPSQDFICSLIRGGGQQEALRSGTENVMGIYSIKLALESVIKNYDEQICLKEKSLIENAIIDKLKDNVQIAGYHTKRNSNTTYMILKDTKTDILITAFDMKSIDISSGSACSSGTIKPSRVLMSMGYTEQEAKSSLRLSFSPFIESGESRVIIDKILPILDKFI